MDQYQFHASSNMIIDLIIRKYNNDSAFHFKRKYFNIKRFYSFYMVVCSFGI